MIVAIDPECIWVVRLNNDVRVVSISPIAGVDKAWVSVDVALAPDKCATWAYINVLFATLDITVVNRSRAINCQIYLRTILCLVPPNDAID